MAFSKIVVLDHGIPELMENKIFNPIFAKKVSHTILPTCFLYKEALKRGIQFITPDVYLKEKPQNALLMSHLETSYTKKLISLGAKPIILTCQESPFIATRFYINLKRISSLYKHTFVFKGMRKYVSSKTIYHQTYFTQPYNFENFKIIDFNKKGFLTMIANAKGLKRLKRYFKTLILRLMYNKKIRELYSERIKAIKFFSQKGDFDLFGFWWDKANVDKATKSAIKKIWRGGTEEKLEILRNYKFVLCFENAIFEGYVTEKIFDALFAGCVPIYWGAPDIEEYVDRSCFIDVRNFQSYDGLYKFLKEIDENKYNQYIENIKTYLQSELFLKFSQESFTKEILEILNQEFKNYGKS